MTTEQVRDSGGSRSPRVYIHEFVDIIGHNRASYFQHITANWSPIGQAERRQKCFGIWGTVGSTARWPEVINLWEYDDWSHLGFNFQVEFDHPTLQDPALADWWAAAASFRSGGFDRILVAADYSPSIDDLCARGVHGHLYAHEMITCPPGGATRYLEALQATGLEAHAQHGAELVGAFRTAMVDDREVILLWAFPNWQAWADFELGYDTAANMHEWRTQARSLSTELRRFLMVDAPLSPLRTGRQPSESDRVGYGARTPSTDAHGSTPDP
jgi:hypothetical protein